MKIKMEFAGPVNGLDVFLDGHLQSAGRAYTWEVLPGVHTIRIEKAPAIFCRGWMGRVFLYHVSMMRTEFSLQSVLDHADTWVMEAVVQPESDLYLRVRSTETRMTLTEGHADCTEVQLTRSASPEAVRKVRLAYLMPIMVLFGLLALLFAGATVFYAVNGEMISAALVALVTAGWCVFSWKRLHRLWHSDQKAKRQ